MLLRLKLGSCHVTPPDKLEGWSDSREVVQLGLGGDYGLVVIYSDLVLLCEAIFQPLNSAQAPDAW